MDGTDYIKLPYNLRMQRWVKVRHQNLVIFLGHLHRATVDCMNDVARLTNGLHICRPKKKKIYLVDESRI